MNKTKVNEKVLLLVFGNKYERIIKSYDKKGKNIRVSYTFIYKIKKGEGKGEGKGGEGEGEETEKMIVPCVSALKTTRRSDIANLNMEDICGCDPEFRAILRPNNFVNKFEKIYSQLDNEKDKHNKDNTKIIGIFCHRGQHRSMASALYIKDMLNVKGVDVEIRCLNKKWWSDNAKKNFEMWYK